MLKMIKMIKICADERVFCATQNAHVFFFRFVVYTTVWFFFFG